MNTMEARIIIENTGNYVEEEIEEVIKVYETVKKHIGFKDNRRDNRFIVKFHDIFYYTPDECEAAETDGLFETFCSDMYDNIIWQANEKHIDIDSMLHPMCVGHYQAFMIDIPEITENNAIDIAMKVYDEFPYEGVEYVENYIYLVEILQDLEDNYMTYWIEFLEGNDYLDEKTIKEIKDTYEKDMERRKAATTLAK